jgi:hypothetical protein
METINLQNPTASALRASQVYSQTQHRTAPESMRAPAEAEQPAQTSSYRGVAGKQALSLNEMATLHMLFGSEKPNEQNFYGQQRAPQIHKGHLLDVSG